VLASLRQELALTSLGSALRSFARSVSRVRMKLTPELDGHHPRPLRRSPSRAAVVAGNRIISPITIRKAARPPRDGPIRPPSPVAYPAHAAVLHGGGGVGWGYRLALLALVAAGRRGPARSSARPCGPADLPGAPRLDSFLTHSSRESIEAAAATRPQSGHDVLDRLMLGDPAGIDFRYAASVWAASRPGARGRSRYGGDPSSRRPAPRARGWRTDGGQRHAGPFTAVGPVVSARIASCSSCLAAACARAECRGPSHRRGCRRYSCTKARRSASGSAWPRAGGHRRPGPGTASASPTRRVAAPCWSIVGHALSSDRDTADRRGPVRPDRGRRRGRGDEQDDAAVRQARALRGGFTPPAPPTDRGGGYDRGAVLGVAWPGPRPTRVGGGRASLTGCAPRSLS